MSRFGVGLFSWLQNAPFYRELHRRAVALAPAGKGERWIDVGCGPGLVARLARDRGYAPLGLDRDGDMIAAARRGADSRGCRFEVGDLSSPHLGIGAPVVSAASFLFVLPDRAAGLAALWRAVHPGGLLLVVETTPAMTPAAARSVARGVPRGRRLGLHLWARARRGRAVPRHLFEGVPAVRREEHDLLGGLVSAHLLHKAPEP